MSTTIYRVQLHGPSVESFIVPDQDAAHWLHTLRLFDRLNLYFILDPEKNHLTAMG